MSEGGAAGLDCQACGFENPDSNRFCGGCGAELATAPSATPGPSVPTTLGGGRYRTDRLLGEGARKRVYLATDERLGREVAVAVVKTDGLDEAGRVRITREAQAMARLGDDPHIVTVYDVGDEADGTPFIVSQYMAGGSLDEELARANGHLPLARALTVMGQIARALAHAHELGIVHRDVKPANVWLDADGAARLGDFGLAATDDASRITTEGTVLGTLAYLAPEQALGREPEPRSDLYALGALGYELLCGRPPFLGDDAVSVVSQHLNTPPVTPRLHDETIPEAVEALLLALLAKDPVDRPGSAAEVAARLDEVGVGTGGSATPVAAADLPTATAGDWGRFVGRSEELDQLRAAFDDAFSGRTRLMMVVGEPGIGKTRTVEELGTHASVRGAEVLWGHSYDGEIGVPYLPWVEALRGFVRQLSHDGSLIEPLPGCAELATIVPELRDLFPQLPELPALDGEAARHRLFEGVTAFVEASTSNRPLLIVLDDLHWADKPSLLLLTHLARRVRRARLLIVGTYRDVELERSHPLAETISTLRRENLYERVLLRGLTVAGVKTQIEAIGGQETPEAFAELIHRETEGNPFFVTEILRHLVETGALRHEHGAWVGDNADVLANLPEGVREVIGRRLDGLSEECNAALTVAAAMPGGFTVDIVGDVAGLDEDTMLDVLDEALAAQVLRERRDRPGTYEFNHALIRQTLYGELSTPRRVRMHKRVGDALEDRFADSIDAHLSELAFHAYEAAPGGDVDKAVAYARRAGDLAMSQAAYEEAVRSYEMADQALELQAEADPGRHADVLLSLARAADRGGDTEGSERAARRAGALARQLDDPYRLGRAGVEYVGSYWVSGSGEVDRDAASMLDEAAERLKAEPRTPERDALLATVLSRKAAAVVFRDRVLHRETAAEAVALARAAGDPQALAEALQTHLTQVLPRAERERLLRELVASAEAAGDLDLTQSSRNTVMMDSLFDHRHEEFRQAIDDYAADAERSRVTIQMINALQLRASLAAIEARYDDAEALLLESADQARSQGEHNLLANVGVGLAPVYRETGRLASFEDATRRIVAETPDIPAWRAGLVQLLVEIGHHDEAAQLVREMVADPGVFVVDDVLFRYTLCMLTEAAAAIGDTESLQQLDEALRGPQQRYDPDDPYPGAVMLGTMAYHGAYSRYLGLAATGLGHHDEAVARHERALADHGQLGARGWEARSRYDLAQALQARGRPGDADRAGGLLNEVTAAANELGMVKLLEEALAARLERQGVSNETPLDASIDIVRAQVATDRPPLDDQAGADGRVTICFSDVEGYTAMTDRLGDQRSHELLRVHNTILRTALRAHGGTEVKSEGDGFMLAFPEPGSAVAFAADLQRALDDHVWPDDVGRMRVRMGIHVGEVIREADDFFGRTVIVCARVASSAAGGEVLVTDEVRAATAARFAYGEPRDLRLKGLSGTWSAAVLQWGD